MLTCTDLTHAYKDTVRLASVSLQVPRGSMFALFGHNGCGKSTLLKMLGGSLPVRTGQVTWQNQSALSTSGYLRQGIRHQVGVLFQSTSSDEKLSVLDNLLFSARLYGLDASLAQARARETLALASLTDRAHDAVKKLSGGMRRRLELYRCFIHQPQLLLLDEPTAGLDVEERKKFFAFLTNYKQQHNAAIVMASHLADELVCADHIAMMKDGKILEQGTPAAMLKRLNYLRCSFVVDATHDLKLDSLPLLFDRKQNPHGTITAKFTASHLDDFLQSSVVRAASFSSLSIDRPSLADVYCDLVQDEARHD